jgi:ubiquinone biosynthesis protein
MPGPATAGGNAAGDGAILHQARQALSTRADLLSEASPPTSALQDHCRPSRRGRAASSKPSSARRSCAVPSDDAGRRRVDRPGLLPSPPTAATSQSVLRPGIEKAFERDLDLFYWMAELVRRTQPRSAAEAGRFGERLRRHHAVRWICAWRRPPPSGETSPSPGYRAPTIDWDHTAQRADAERVDGIPIGDREYRRRQPDPDPS